MKYSLFPFSRQNIFFFFLEAVLIIAGTRILHEGVCYLLHGTADRLPDREESISLVLMGVLGFIGLPKRSLADLTLTEISVYIILLTLGYLIGVRGQENRNTSQMRELMKHKLKDFSESFRKLSHAMAAQTDRQFQMTNHEMREMMEQISSQVCERCEHRELCMGQLELSRAEMFGTLQAYCWKYPDTEQCRFPLLLTIFQNHESEDETKRQSHMQLRSVVE